MSPSTLSFCLSVLSIPAAASDHPQFGPILSSVQTHLPPPMRFVEQIFPRVASFSSDGKLLVTGNHDGTIMLWRLASYKDEWRLHLKKDILKDQTFQVDNPLGDQPYMVAFSGDGKRVFCASEGHIAEISSSDGKVLRIVKLPRLGSYAVQ